MSVYASKFPILHDKNVHFLARSEFCISLLEVWPDCFLMKFCPECGAAMEPSSEWPRKCVGCGRDHFKNPIPVAVVLLPVDDGLLVVRREVGPGSGKLALPGGFVNWGGYIWGPSRTLGCPLAYLASQLHSLPLTSAPLRYL